MLNNWIKMTLVVLALGVGACSSGSGGKSPGSGGSGGSTGAAGSGGTGGAGGSAPTTLEGCAALSTPQAINDCILNLPADSTVTAQPVTFTPAANYNDCKM
jgi:hypothetical protein